MTNAIKTHRDLTVTVPWYKNPEVLCLGLTLLLVLFIMTPVYLYQAQWEAGDYQAHIRFVAQLLDGEWDLSRFLQQVPHFLFHLFIGGLHLLTGMTLESAAIVVSVGSYAAEAVLLYVGFRIVVGAPTNGWQVGLYTLLILTVMMMTQVFIFTPDSVYYAYAATNAYHNPTIVLLEPFALLLFGLVSLILGGYPLSKVQMVVGLALLTVLSILAKPNYIITLVPALMLIGAYQYWQRQPIHWVMIAAIAIPAIVLIGLQSQLLSSTFATTITPFGFAVAHEQFNWLIVPKGILSILFPLLVYGLYFRQARQTRWLNLAWLCLIIGLISSNLLAEAGRERHGNWTWNTHITLFIAYAASVVFFVAQNRQVMRFPGSARPTRAFWVCLIALALHVISGVLWYADSIQWIRLQR